MRYFLRDKLECEIDLINSTTDKDNPCFVLFSIQSFKSVEMVTNNMWIVLIL